MPAQIHDISNAAYHADHSRISPSGMKILLDSPADFKERFVDDPPRPFVQTEAMTLGSMVDTMVWEPEKFDELYLCRPEGIDGRSAKGKVELAAFRKDCIGKTETTPEAMAKARGMRAAVLRNEQFRIAYDNPDAKRQLTLLGEDAETGEPDKCRLDLWVPQPDEPYDVIVDLKTTCDPSPEKWERGSDFNPIVDFRYDLQMVHYDLKVQEWSKRPCVLALFVVGSKHPHDTLALNLRNYYERGLAWRRYAIGLLRSCRKTGIWLHPQQRRVIVPAPSKYTAMPNFEELGEEEAEIETDAFEME